MATLFVDKIDPQSGTSLTIGSSGDTVALTSGVTLGSGFNFTLSSTLSTSSGTSVSFTGIPSTARLIIVNFSDFSKNGGNGTVIQLGTSGGIVTSGYQSNGSRFSVGDAIMGRNNENSGFVIADENSDLEVAGQAIITCVDVSNHKWVFSFMGRAYGSQTLLSGGFASIGGTVTQLRVKPTGSNTFDTGEINIQYI